MFGKLFNRQQPDKHVVYAKLLTKFGQPVSDTTPNPEPVRQTDAERAESEQRYQKWNENRYGKDNK